MSLPAATSATSKPTRIRTSSMSSTKFPFPEGSFAPAQLSATQIRTYEKQIQILMNQALNECDRADTLGHAAFDRSWDIVGAQDGVTALRRREINATSRSQYRVIGNIACEYKDLMELYYAERSEELYEWLQFMFHHTLDAQVIQTIETATTQNPHHYFGVKWAVFQTSKMGGKVDQTFIEYMTYRKDIRGRDVGIRVTLPIRLAEIDHTMDALKIRRLSSQMVQIVRPITEGQTRMFVMIDNDEPLSYPAAYAKTLLTMSQNFPTCIDSRRIRRRGLKPESRWVTNHARRSCVVCTNTFGAMRGRHHCRLCGEVICRKCMLVRETAEPLTHKTFKIAVTKFCVLCIANIRRGPDVDDLTASRLVSSSKVREMEFAPADLEQLSCVSITSETESEDCRADFDFDSARSSVSSTSEQDSDKHSFGKRLEEITEHNEDTISEDGVNGNAKPTTGRKAKPELVLFVPDETTDTAEFMVTIDTKDMQRERRVDSDSQLSSSSVSSPNRSRTSSWNKPSSTRSIDQCLAEQEALLRQMVLATHGTPMHRHDPQHYEYDA